MSCNIQVEKNYDAPAFAGNFRFLLGLAMLLIGFWVTLLGDFQGHGLAFILVFAAPFIIFKDAELIQNSRGFGRTNGTCPG